MTAAPAYDVAVVGAGPVGTVAALLQARRGRRVALFEANTRGARRLAGEWLHPPAVAVLRGLGLDPVARFGPYPTGEGFVVFPDDGGAPIELPYADGGRGFSLDHVGLVEWLREAARADPRIDYYAETRVVGVDPGALTAHRRGEASTFSVTAGLIVGADGRHSLVRDRLGLANGALPSSRMAGLVLEGAELPHEGKGHLFVGAPGPVLAYRLGLDRLRLIADMPLEHGAARERATYLWEGYGPVLPASLRPAFRRALASGELDMAVNAVSPRASYGRDGLVVIGDAAGHYNPLTAIGITFGTADAVALAESDTAERFDRARGRAVRVPEIIAIGLYEAFSGHGRAATAVRHAIFEMWRRDARERTRTLRYLTTDERRIGLFARSFARVVAGGLTVLLRRVHEGGSWAGFARDARDIARNAVNWVATAIFLRPIFASAPTPALAAEDAAGADAVNVDTRQALVRGVAALLARQQADGGFEGEVEWCPLLAAEFVLACRIAGRPIGEVRKRRLIRHFQDTRLPSGLWGLHPHSEPYLFTTTLVYVAARLLGVAKEDPLLAPAGAFFAGEGGVLAIPSWGKFWLAMLNLYDWSGVNPVPPEAWALPRWAPLHPGKLYCHTRLIYTGMAAIYGRKFRAPLAPDLAEIRAELYPDGYDLGSFAAARGRLRAGDLVAAPGLALRALHRVARLVESCHRPDARRRLIARLTERIRWELWTTDHTSISPVSGLFNIVALWLADPGDPDLARAWERFEGWIWEDDERGLRVAGARSLSWDTGFALQALAAAAPHVASGGAARRGAALLATQQIGESVPGFADNDRTDPQGGWCFAGVWHGWPVSDCTAEAVSGLLTTEGFAADAAQLHRAARFMLRCRNRDGGFGSYEPRRTRLDLERLNPAEMFGESMTEASYVECTASCVAALARIRERCPSLARAEIDGAIAGGARWLRRAQRPDGSWPGVWGVGFIYGTMFAIEGLRAAGASPVDPAILAAADWFVARQRADGGWGEHHSSCRTGRYVAHRDGQVIQTAWALRALLAAEAPQWKAIDRGAVYLALAQKPDGTWPRQDMAGVFFKTALLEYELYRFIFPVWALGLYETRRAARAGIGTGRAITPEAA